MAKTEIVDQDTGEIIEVVRGENLPARKNYDGVLISGLEYDVVGLVNVPTLKHDSGTSIAIKMLQAIIETTNVIVEPMKIDGVLREVEREVKINVARVMSLADGLEYEYVIGAIGADSFKTAYPEDGYVGKFFALKKGDVVPGKRYKAIEILEITPRQ